MLTITITALALVTLGLGLVAKTIAADKRLLNRLIAGLWPVIVIAAVLAATWTNLDTAVARPAFLLYLVTPIIGGVLYRVRQWHKRHPGVFSGIAAGAITRAVSGSRRRRTRQKSTRQRMAADMPAPRGYVRAMLAPWAGLVTSQDTAKWGIIHVLALWAGAMIALNVTAEVAPGYLVYVVALALAGVSFYRWWKVDRARQKHIRAMFGTAADQFQYDKAVRNAHLPDREAYSRPETTIDVTWRSMIEPDVIRIRFPQTWPKTQMRKREEFAAEWEATFKSDTVKKYEWDTGAQTVSIIAAHYPENARWNGQVVGEWHYFVVGLSLDTGEPVGFSVKDNAPHILVAGETGSGKSELMFVVVGQALLKGWLVAIMDPKGTGWITWTQNYRYTDEWGFQTGSEPLREGDARPGIVEHATELYGIYQTIQRVHAEMERRKRLNAKYKVTNTAEIPADKVEEEGASPYLAVIDEALSLFATDKGSSEDVKARNEIRGEILSTALRLIVEARAQLIHLEMGFQRPDTRYVDGSARDNMGIRLALGQMTEDGTKMMFGTTEGVPSLPLRKDGDRDQVVKGRGQARMGSGQPVVNFQSFWCGPEQADLDEYLPMPAPPAEGVGPAPKEHDTKLGEDAEFLPAPEIPEGEDTFNPYLDDDAEPAQEAAQGTGKAPANQAQPTKPQAASAAQGAAQGKSKAKADPFGAPGDNPWGRAAPDWPGVTSPEGGDTSPEADDQKRPSFRDAPTKTTKPQTAASAAPAAPETVETPGGVLSEGQIVDSGQGREKYAVPVVWEQYEPLETAEGTSTDPMAGFWDEDDDEELGETTPADDSEDETMHNADDTTPDPQEARGAVQEPAAEPRTDKPAPAAPAAQEEGISAADFDCGDDDEDRAPAPAAQEPEPVQTGLGASDFDFGDDDEAPAPAPAAPAAQEEGISAADFDFGDDDEDPAPAASDDRDAEVASLFAAPTPAAPERPAKGADKGADDDWID